MVLSSDRIKAYYDWFGARQDSQSFYEDAPVAAMVARSDLSEAERVFEFGCGTGRLARDLLENHLSPTATYVGCDLSSTMVRLAEARLRPFGDRARIVQSTDSISFPEPDASVDRVISTYVFDLLSESDMHRVLDEARRVLRPGGRIGLVSLTEGTTLPSRVVSSMWSAIFRHWPSLVGGCRPIRLGPLLESGGWTIVHREVIVRFGVPSEVWVAARLN